MLHFEFCFFVENWLIFDQRLPPILLVITYDLWDKLPNFLAMFSPLDACGGLIEAVNGTITSPSFPDFYPPNKNCIWEVLAPPQWKITVNFTHFDIEGNNVSSTVMFMANKKSLKIFRLEVAIPHSHIQNTSLKYF